MKVIDQVLHLLIMDVNQDTALEEKDVELFVDIIMESKPLS
jgi:hypothetical protein